MSKLYPDLETNFPEAVDEIDKMQDLTIYTKPIADTYQTLMSRGDVAVANNDLEQNPVLESSIFNAKKHNQIRDGMIGMQRFFINEINDYLADLHDMESIDGGTY